MFTDFKYQHHYDYSKGWDRYALDYQELLLEETVYFLTKEMMHEIVGREFENPGQVKVLDVNCGTGNDFPFFFRKGWKVTACDGSAGMLNKAWKKYEEQITSGQLKLKQGMIENISHDDFKDEQFDMIFSVTGGFSYITDEQLLSVNKVLSGLLKPDGKIIVANLNRFCLAESLHRLYTMKRPNLRSGKTITVNIKGEEHTMHLRSPSVLRKIYADSFTGIRLFPLLAFTPPYQTGFKPRKRFLNFLRNIEKKANSISWLSAIADQVVVVGRGGQGVRLSRS